MRGGAELTPDAVILGERHVSSDFRQEELREEAGITGQQREVDAGHVPIRIRDVR